MFALLRYKGDPLLFLLNAKSSAVFVFFYQVIKNCNILIDILNKSTVNT